MTEHKKTIQPCSLLCVAAVVIGSGGATVCPLLGDSPSSVLPFEMLLQLPEKKLHGHLFMASQLYSLQSHGGVAQLERIQSKVTQRCVPSFFVWRFQPALVPSNVGEQIWGAPIDALVTEAAQCSNDHTCEPLIFPLCQPFVCMAG